MESAAVAIVRRTVEAISDRTLRDRAGDLLDPSFVRHDLVELFPDSEGPGGASDLWR
jgi:hypothetical protein